MPSSADDLSGFMIQSSGQISNISDDVKRIDETG